jgi:hypothetical protein
MKDDINNIEIKKHQYTLLTAIAKEFLRKNLKHTYKIFNAPKTRH